MFFATLAGRAVPRLPPEAGLPGLLVILKTRNPAPIAGTATTLPAVISARLRTSARRAAARCAAIFSLAFFCLSLVALLMPALPHPSGFLWPDSGTCLGPARAAPPAHARRAAAATAAP